MKIGILGSGTVAKKLGLGWAKAGHEVCMGARDPHAKKVAVGLQGTGSQVQIGTTHEAAEFGEVILLAINPWTEIEGILRSLKHDIVGKTIIDVSNNIDFAASPPKFAFSTASMGQSVQKWAPKSHVVKTLNLTPAAMMVNPQASGIKPAITWVAGNNQAAKQQVAELLRDLGWGEVADLGGIEQSRLQEVMGLVLTLVVTSI